MNDQTGTRNGDLPKTGRTHAKSMGAVQEMNPNFPPPKTDKPRPHICTTCTRSFARLEHLKRHERSHTKEKPFACNECPRCFARRDLLLRHQQKLHMSAPPSSRSRRRESTSNTAPNGSTRVRKNSMVNNAAGQTNGSMRPRANTISHVDNTTFEMLAAANPFTTRTDANAGYSHTNMTNLPGVGNHHYRGMSSASGQHGDLHVLPRLKTRDPNADVGASMRTAPAYPGFGDVSMDNMFYGPGSTINPAQLHFPDSPQTYGFQSPATEFYSSYQMFPQGQPSLESDGNYPWMNSFDHQMSFNEQAIDNSSPSAADSASPRSMGEMMFEDATNPTTGGWQNPVMSQAPYVHAYSQDFPTQPYQDMYGSDHLSPKSSNTPIGSTEQYFASPQMAYDAQGMFTGNQFYANGMSVKPDTPSNSTASISSSNRRSSATSVSTDSITDASKHASNFRPDAHAAGHNYSNTILV